MYLQVKSNHFLKTCSSELHLTTAKKTPSIAMDGVNNYFYQTFYSSIFTCLYLCLPDKKVYTAGITNKVRIKENKIPPTTTIPNGIRLVEAAPRLNAIGKAPN